MLGACTTGSGTTVGIGAEWQSMGQLVPAQSILRIPVSLPSHTDPYHDSSNAHDGLGYARQEPCTFQ
jgi:hypothetical protein